MANYRIPASIQCDGPDVEHGGTRCSSWGDGTLGLTTNHEFQEVLTVVEVPEGWAHGLPTADPRGQPVLCPNCAKSYAHDLRFRATIARDGMKEEAEGSPDLGGDAHRGSVPS